MSIKCPRGESFENGRWFSAPMAAGGGTSLVGVAEDKPTSIWGKIGSFFTDISEGFIQSLDDMFTLDSRGLPVLKGEVIDEMSNAILGGLLGTPSGGSGIKALKLLVSELRSGKTIDDLGILFKKWGAVNKGSLIQRIEGVIDDLTKLDRVKGSWKNPRQDRFYKPRGRFSWELGGAVVSDMSKGNILIATGSRGYSDYNTIYKSLKSLVDSGQRPRYIVHGGAAGADSLVELAAKSLGIPTKVYSITAGQWQTLGKVAGLERNSQMLWDSVLSVGIKNVKSISFFDGKISPGTADMTEKLILSGVDGVVKGLTPKQYVEWTNTWVK